ncbi:hypothetical protein WN943_018350 [Citrus x changshan-huyou]
MFKKYSNSEIQDSFMRSPISVIRNLIGLLLANRPLSQHALSRAVKLGQQSDDEIVFLNNKNELIRFEAKDRILERLIICRSRVAQAIAYEESGFTLHKSQDVLVHHHQKFLILNYTPSESDDQRLHNRNLQLLNHLSSLNQFRLSIAFIHWSCNPVEVDRKSDRTTTSFTYYSTVCSTVYFRTTRR